MKEPVPKVPSRTELVTLLRDFGALPSMGSDYRAVLSATARVYADALASVDEMVERLAERLWLDSLNPDTRAHVESGNYRGWDEIDETLPHSGVAFRAKATEYLRAAGVIGEAK